MKRIKVLIVLSLLLSAFFCTAQKKAASFKLMEYGTKTPVAYGGERSDSPVYVPCAYRAKKNEFRGVWVSTIENIDIGKYTSAAAFRSAYNTIVSNLKNAGFNAIIFQVRPMNDAFYPSRLNPWSRWMTGSEGAAFADEPAFDPLHYMVNTAHRAGLEFHAWLNPYRVISRTPLSKEKYLKTLDPKNFARKNPHLVLAIPYDGGRMLILNPGEPQVIRFLLQTVQEIVKKYNVDAIHFDDYFYPYADVGSADAATFKKYAAKGETLENWRRRNVDTFIYSLSVMLRKHNQTAKKNVKLGISPFGIWANRSLTPAELAKKAKAETKAKPEKDDTKKTQSRAEGSLTGGAQSYFKQFADTRRWVRSGWIDYIVPQLYWGFSHRTAPYAALADWWAGCVRGTKCRLYTGHAVYRLGSKSADWKHPMELTCQLLYNSVRPDIHGVVFFSYVRVFQPQNRVKKNEAQRIIRTLWRKKYPAEAKK